MQQSPTPEYFVDPRPAPQPLARSSHLTWVDTAKGFGIILVVFGHALRGLVSSEILRSTPLVRFVDDWIYAFHMPLFFFLSGLFLYRSTSKPWVDFAGDKLRRLAYPYFVWSVVTLMFKAALGSVANHPEELSQFPLIFYEPIDQFWFLYSLFIIVMTVSVALKLGTAPWVIFGSAILLYPGLLPISSFGLGILHMTRLMAVYFALGVIIGNDQNIRRISSTPVWWLRLAVAAGLIVSSLAGWFEAPYRDAFLLKATFAMSGIMAVLALALLVDQARLGAAFRLLGRYSLEIYLVHTIAAAGARVLLIKFAHISAPAPHLVLSTLAGLYIPIGLDIPAGRLPFRLRAAKEPTARPDRISRP